MRLNYYDNICTKEGLRSFWYPCRLPRVYQSSFDQPETGISLWRHRPLPDFFWYFCTYRTWSGTTSKSPFLNVLLKCRETEVVSCSVKKKNTKTTNLGLIYKLKSRYQNTRFYAYTLPTQNQYQNFGKPWDTCRKFIFTTKKNHWIIEKNH